MERKQTASDVARVLEIQVSAARKHLESMQEQGLVKYEYSRNGVGRPKKIFSLTEAGRDLFPNQYSHVLNLMLTKMLNDKETWQVEEMLEGVAKEIGDQIKSEVGSENPEDIFGALNRFGFESQIGGTAGGREEGDLLIVSKHCPLFKVASKHQELICHSFHSAILRSAFSTDKVELESCMSMGASQCGHHVVTNLPNRDGASDKE